MDIFILFTCGEEQTGLMIHYAGGLWDEAPSIRTASRKLKRAIIANLVRTNNDRLEFGRELWRLETWARNLPVPSAQAPEPRVDKGLSHVVRISGHMEITTITQISSDKSRRSMDVVV